MVPLPYSLERSTCYFDRLEATYILKSSHNLCQNDTKLQTHPASILNVKMLNLAKIDVYNFKYKISVGNTMKLFFLLHKCIKKQVHKLEHKWIDYTASSPHITPIAFSLLFLVNYKWFKKFQVEVLWTIFIWFSTRSFSNTGNNILPV